MSSILDALNKSEAERRRGQPPTLGSHLPPHRRPPPQRRRTWLLPALAVVALGVAWLGGLFDTGAPEPQADAAATAAGEASAPETIAGAQTPELSPRPDTTPVPEPAAPTGTGEPATASRGRGFGPFPPAAQPAPAETIADPPAAQQAQTATPPPPPPASPPPAEQARPPHPPTAATAAPIAAAPPVDAPVQSASGNAGQPALPTMYELPFSVRRTLPEIAITMHMYSPDPELRFALVNGTRARDGQPLAGGLEVIAIRTDGVVFRYDGTEFLHPIRP